MRGAVWPRLRREAAAVNEETGPTSGWRARPRCGTCWRNRIKDDLKAGEIGTALERYDTVERCGCRCRSTDHRYADPCGQIEGLYLRAKLAEEFSGLRLDISGVCVNDTGKLGRHFERHRLSRRVSTWTTTS